MERAATAGRGLELGTRALALAALPFASCRIAGPPPDRPLPPAESLEPAPRASAVEVRPTLEEIFLIPGIHGEPPKAESLSADGRWLVARWRPTRAGEQGRRSYEGESALRLIEVESSAPRKPCGTLLSSLLPKAEGEAPEAGSLPYAWSRNGSRLALARGSRVFLLDRDPAASAWRAKLVLAEPEAPASRASEPASAAVSAAPSSEDPQPAPREATKAPRLGTVTSLAFDRDGTSLIVEGIGRFRVPVAAPEDSASSGGGEAPLSLEEAEWLTRDVEAPATALLWSEDLRVVLSRDKPVAKIALAAGLAGGPPAAEAPDPPGTAPSAAAPPSLSPPAFIEAQVYLRDEGRAVVLDGWSAMRWRENPSLSPDGRFAFAFDADRPEDRQPTIVPDFLTPRVTTRSSRRELADDLPPPRRAHVWDTRSGARTELAFPGEPPRWVSFHGWAPQPPERSPEGAPARFLLTRLEGDFRSSELWLWEEGPPAEPATWRVIWRDRDERWLGGPAGPPRWTRDGERVLVATESEASSSTPGRCQLHALDPRSGELRPLTAVAGEVSDFVPLEDGSAVLVASGADPARRFLHHVPAEAVRGEVPALARELVRGDGMIGRLVACASGSRVVFERGELGRPDELWCASTLQGELAAALTAAAPPEFEGVDWILPVKMWVEDGAGSRARAHVWLPRETSLERPDRPRPAVVFAHGAGYLQNVTDSMSEYAVNLMFHSRLAALGYVVLDVDYRGSAGYGNRFRTDVQYHLGGADLGDIQRAVDQLAARGVIDPARVGIYGGSYGGFLALMALFTDPGRFACGAALRSVTDWRTYTNGYTQPRLGRPSTHPEAYARSSPIDHAEKLADPLLILHGLVDSNVFAQDSIRLIEKLIDCGKDFEAMLYPSQGHAFDDGMHWLDEYRRIECFLCRHLGPP